MPTRRFSSSPATGLPPSSSPARPKNPSLPPSAAAAPRSSSLPFVFMGQGPSRSTSPAVPDTPPPPPPSSSAASKGFQAALAGGSRLKRAFVGRRKISEDVSYLFGFGNKREPVQEQPLRVEPCVPLTSSLSLPAAKANLAGKPPSNFSTPSLMTPPDHLLPDKIPLSPPPPPPPPPKTRAQQQHHHQEVAQEILVSPAIPATLDNRSSIIPLSPGITNAVTLMVLNEKEQSIHGASSKLNLDYLDAGQDLLPKPKPRDADTARWEGAAAADVKEKEARRKSDSTMSYHTIRPGTTSNRTSRPVSIQSNHTVKPVRISALITDADFTMLEEDDDTPQDEVIVPIPPVIIQKGSPEASLKTKSRRSLSLNLGSYSSPKNQPPPPPPPLPSSHHPTLSLAEIKYPSYSVTEGIPPLISPPTPSTAKEMPKSVQTSVPGQTGPVASPRLPVGQNLRGKLSSWTHPSPSERKLPPLPPQTLPMPPSQPLHVPRAISMTSNLAPAAGRVLRGAVGRMGRVIGINPTSSNSTSASSSPPTTSDLTRTNSNHSSSPSHSSSASHSYSPMAWGRRRTPEASSGSWSVSPSVTSTFVSDVDHLGVPSGPVLGLMVRAPFNGPGVVFGNELELAVKETAVGATLSSGEGRRGGEWERMDVMKRSKMRDAEKAIEDRRLPAVIVRCAQHILTWGVEEEGIFRVPGRSKHVSTLRSEFDKGADYDLAACEPGDLDPHAVASVFKAYFRELPEHMLTQVLLPYFEGVVERETAAASAATESKLDVKPASRGLGPPHAGNLPPALKKPPSLSTLAMPSFKDIPPPSNSLIRAIRALISQLPEENRDLLRTLVDIINATAKNEKATKMPLANLVLVFYPTVQMTPPLLRILCETKGIWDGESETFLVDVKKEDGGKYASSSPGIFSEGHSGAAERESDGGAWTSEDHKSSLASGGGSINLNEEFVRRRPLARPRRNPETVYMDAECRCSSASLLLHAADSSRDNASLSSNKLPDASSPSSTPPMTSSVESLITPGTSSQPSLPHLPMNGNEKHETEDMERMSESVAPESTQYILPGPVQFPSLPSNLPSSPLKRRSTPILSLPHVMPSSVHEPPSPTFSSHSNSSSSRRLKLKKPSLQLFLSSKRSNSSLQGISKLNISSPVLNNDSATALNSATDSSVSTPQSAVTAPQESAYALPPVVGTPFESSPLGLGTGIQLTPSELTLDHQCEEDFEEASTADAIKTGTPIADRYGADPTSSSTLSIAISARSVPEASKKSPLRLMHKRPVNSVSSNHLGILDQELDSGDEWTHSVLLAADISHDRTQDHGR